MLVAVEAVQEGFAPAHLDLDWCSNSELDLFDPEPQPTTLEYDVAAVLVAAAVSVEQSNVERSMIRLAAVVDY